MRPVELVIEGFRSFGERRVFRFPSGPGLYFMWGDNKAEPGLGRNGAGKSSTFEALTWLAQGRTSRGLRAGDVATWGAATTRVALRIVEEGAAEPHELVRTWHPNSFTLNGEDLPADGGAWASWLRLTPQGWLNCVLMAQGQPMFLDLKPEAKASFFSDLLGLDAWLDRSQAATRLAVAAERDLAAAERELAEVEGRLAGMASIRAGLDARAEEWERERGARRDRLAAEHAEELDNLRKAVNRRDDLARGLSLARSELRDAAQEVEKARGAFDDARSRVAQGVIDLERARAHLAHLEGHVEMLSRGECPTCHQKVPAPDYADVQEVGVAEESVRLASARLDVLKEAERWTRRNEDATREAERASRRHADDLEADHRRAGIEVERVERRLDAIEDEDDALASAANPHRVDVADEEARLHRRADAARQAAATASERQLAFQYWARGFKDLRMEAMAEALGQFEVEANAEAEQLGLHGWSIMFEVDRETKGGGVQRGFQVTISGPGTGSDRPVPWEAWSGGEGQRLRLAAQMGLANLVRRRTGTPLMLEVWDEPTQWLGERGVYALLDALRERSRREGLQVWVVDHRSLGYGGFDGTVGVVKTARRGSEFVDASYISEGGE